MRFHHSVPVGPLHCGLPCDHEVMDVVLMGPLALLPPRMRSELGKLIGVGVLIYLLYVCGPKKILNRNLAIDSHFQTFAVGLRLALPLLSPEMLSSSNKSRIFLFNVHLALYVRMDDTIIPAHTHRSM